MKDVEVFKGTDMRTALVVDDHPENIYLLRCLLAADGFEVLEAENGVVALECAQQHKIDLVISDVLMPGMDGFSLCREWRQRPELRQIPFIFYTATYTDSRDEAFARSLGANDFIVKPTDPIAFRDRVRDVLRREAQSVAPPAAPPSLPLAPYLQQYNEVLIRKLENKLIELEQANQALQLKDFALMSSSAGILLSDRSGVISYANPAMQRLSGRTLETLVARQLRDVIELPEDWSEWIACGTASRDFEARFIDQAAHANLHWLRVAAHRVFASENDFRGVMLSCIDVTEERRLRQELSRIQRLEGLGLFAAGVAHDFNNLLMSIQASLELEWCDDATEAERAEYRSMATAAFDRAKDLTRRLLTFSKGQITKRSALELPALLDECILLSLSGSGVRCIRRYSAMHAKVSADSGQLAQVFCNILLNARQAMSDNGTIVVSIEDREAAGVDDRGCEGAVVVSVCDDGPGIAEDHLSRIFEPYFTTKPDGNGLGLATSHAIVTEHGGRIEVVSGVGTGTTFRISLPVTSSSGNALSRRLFIPGVQGSGRVLVMDDEVVLQALLQRALERAGYSVVVVGNGDQALLEFRRAQEKGLPFDLLILDLTVKGGLGGLETLAQLRRVDSRIPAIAATGHGHDQETRQLLASGFQHVLSKPFPMHELLGLVATMLANGPTSR